MERVRIGLVYGLLRTEERLLIAALEQRGAVVERVLDRQLRLDATAPPPRYDVVVERSVSQLRGLHVATLFEAWGVPVVNPTRVLEVCNDKLRTTALLAAAGIPQPRVMVAFSVEEALAAADELGYPVVIKPPLGSWGRLLARVHSRRAAAEVLRHKRALGGFHHGTIYVQEWVPKPGRDIRAFVVGEETICAIYRTAEHWVTNTARGGRASACPVTPELAELCGRVAQALGGGVLAVDILEHPERGLLVNEVNATMEFRNSIAPTGVDIPGRVADYVLSVARQGQVATLATVRS
ncbi:MAG: lysine biosynthesis protein LysX [Thermomicrobium sp.]|nr:lysine biosynthesis protein LysX [Thermomicrobium sp.]